MFSLLKPRRLHAQAGESYKINIIMYIHSVSKIYFFGYVRSFWSKKSPNWIWIAMIRRSAEMLLFLALNPAHQGVRCKPLQSSRRLAFWISASMSAIVCISMSMICRSTKPICGLGMHMSGKGLLAVRMQATQIFHCFFPTASDF